MNKLSPVSGLIRQTLTDFKQEGKIVLAVGALVALPAVLANLMFPTTDTLSVSWVIFSICFFFLFIFWSSLVSAGMYAKIAHPDEIHTMDEAMRTGLKYWVRYWTTSMLQWLYVVLPIIFVALAMVVVIVGFIATQSSHFSFQYIVDHLSTFGTLLLISFVLFIVATFMSSYYSLKYLFSGFVVFKENIANTSARRRSGELTKGRLWDIAGKLFVFGLFMALIGIALGIIDGIAVAPITNKQLAANIDDLFSWIQWMISFPLGLLFTATLYRDIVRANSSPSA